jgi:hypothetical protein
VVGGLAVGLLADAIDPAATITVVAGITALSGLWVAVDLPGGDDRRTASDRLGFRRNGWTSRASS